MISNALKANEPLKITLADLYMCRAHLLGIHRSNSGPREISKPGIRPITRAFFQYIQQEPVLFFVFTYKDVYIFIFLGIKLPDYGLVFELSIITMGVSIYLVIYLILIGRIQIHFKYSCCQWMYLVSPTCKILPGKGFISYLQPLVFLVGLTTSQRG